MSVLDDDTPNWTPLEELVGVNTAGDFMWMYAPYIRLEAYKHIETRRYLHLASDGQPYVYLCRDLDDEGVYRPALSVERELDHVFASSVPEDVEVSHPSVCAPPPPMGFRRVEVMLDEDRYESLVDAARVQGLSAAAVVRQALEALLSC